MMVEKKTIELVDKDTLSADIGDKSQLDTTDKSNLVNAINEVKSEVGNVDLSSCAKAVDVGDKNNLQTNNKNDLVAAINEVFQNANNGKNIIANAIGSPLLNSDTFSVMGDKIESINTKFRNSLADKGVIIAGNESYDTLVNKLPDIKQFKTTLGTDVRLSYVAEAATGNAPKEFTEVYKYATLMKGQLNFSCKYYKTSSGSATVSGFKFVHLSKDNVIKTEREAELKDQQTTTQTLTLELTDVEEGDQLICSTKSTSGYTKVYVKEVTVECNLVSV